MSKPRVIGVLGGMGPEATLALMQRVINRVQAHDDSDHVPMLVDMNTQVPSRIRAIIGGDGPDPAPVLAAMAAGLVAQGAEALVMPCNTAHVYAPQITAAAAGVAFLNMVSLARNQAEARAAGTPVGVLASPAVKMVGLFDGMGGGTCYPADQDALLAAIRDIKKNGATGTARAALRAASGDLLSQGARVQLVACSEFSLIADAVAPGAEVIDTLDVLADAAVAFSKPDEKQD